MTSCRMSSSWGGGISKRGGLSFSLASWGCAESEGVALADGDEAGGMAGRAGCKRFAFAWSQMRRCSEGSVPLKALAASRWRRADLALSLSWSSVGLNIFLAGMPCRRN